ALILGIIGLNQTKTKGQKGRGLAIAGIVLGAIASVMTVFAIIGAVTDAGNFTNIYNQYYDDMFTDDELNDFFSMIRLFK
ncbi:MAG: DUF4190 domain-containing protein, partial [Acutalibacteraceae bacterium]